MSIYKVPQDVEAEDKLVGPFTFRQFVFLIVAAISLFLTIQLFRLNPLFSLLTLPFVIVFGILGVYRRPDQPAEIYLLAVLRYHLKPHLRIWDQEGVIETVRITAPQKEIHQYTDNLSQGEVRSRLDNLARMMDSRGWSVKNADLTTPLGADPMAQSDRLIMPTQTVEPMDVHAYDDILDVYNNPVAQDVDTKMQDVSQHTREEAVQHMRQAAQEPPPRRQKAPPVITPTTPAKKDDSTPSYNPYPSSMHQRVVSPISSDLSDDEQTNDDNPSDQAAGDQPDTTNQAVATDDQSTSAMTQPTSDAILRLANNSDLRVSTLAKEAARIESLEDDQTITLH